MTLKMFLDIVWGHYRIKIKHFDHFSGESSGNPPPCEVGFMAINQRNEIYIFVDTSDKKYWVIVLMFLVSDMRSDIQTLELSTDLRPPTCYQCDVCRHFVIL